MFLFNILHYTGLHTIPYSYIYSIYQATVNENMRLNLTIYQMKQLNK